MTTATSADAIELLIADHRAVEQLFRHLEAALEVGAVENQRDLAQRIGRELEVHAAAEEEVLYPVARELLLDGERIAEESFDGHAEVRRLLAELDGSDPTEERFEACARRLVALVRSHVEEEEGALFPELRGVAGAEQVLEMGAALERAKQAASGRRHPSVPDRPPANIVAGAVAAVADRAREAVRPLL